MSESDPGNNKAFDNLARRILRDLPVEKFDPLQQQQRRQFLRRSLTTALGLATLGVAGWGSVSYATTPQIVKLSISHGEEESLLRGNLIPDLQPALAALSIASTGKFPAYLQMSKACVIGNYQAWHLLAYVDNIGMVQIVSFQGQVPDAAGEGWWLGHYWRFLAHDNHGPTLLFSKSHPALNALSTNLLQLS